MREFQERRYLKKIFLSRFVFFCLAVLLVFLAVSVTKSYKKSREAAALNKTVEDEIKDMNLKKNNLEANIERLKTSVGQEEELRKKFQIKKPGEEVLVIVDEGPAAVSGSTTGQTKSFLEKTWDFLKSIF